MAAKQHTNGTITITYDAEVCTHAARCVKGLPGVVDANRKPWIDPDGATPSEIEAQVARCPSGALGFLRNAD
ncbi:(4Fe-4S)-binding protein [Terricaulis silvestris]|uniref:Divergent 4Fe-4S mono-cluster domain-containing protein n=1 Tax=Terricaulis silvestris TaxID=2686094 RepID=A0A6I6MJN0_9CAUL|nr:(4Fe-4S)-binding protein [Terricaulis silvestris]QGZ93358.1 hypothetical protein DSM104635_00168 [Terricaulis silvestris]